MPVRAVHLQEEVGDVDHSTKRLPATNLMSLMLRAIVKVLFVMTMKLLAMAMVLAMVLELLVTMRLGRIRFMDFVSSSVSSNGH